MRSLGSFKFWKNVGLIGLALNLSAFTAPQKGELLELQGFLHGRSDAKFRDQDNNKIFVLKPGTRAVVSETKYFADTKNYGLCLDVKNATDLPADQKCIWVYYDVKNPALQLYSGITDQKVRDQVVEAWANDPKKVTLKKVSSPVKAQAAETIREVKGIAEKPAAEKAATKASAPPPKPTPKSKPAPMAVAEKKPEKAPVQETKTPEVDTAAVMKSTVKGFDQINRKKDDLMSPSNQCPDGTCNTAIDYSEDCGTFDSYLEPSLKNVVEKSEYSEFFKQPQTEIIKTQCIALNLIKNGGGAKRSCTPDGKVKYHLAKACVSRNYIKVTAKTFNLTAECFGSTGNKSRAEKREFALSVFSLMAQESGMHMNVESNTGAGGAGQLTNDAIGAVNNHLRTIRAQLAQSDNPECTKILTKSFSTRMPENGLCERISTYDGKFIRNMAYSFAYQQIIHDDYINAFFSNKTYDSVFNQLPEEELARLKFTVVGWGHNTGPGGIRNPFSQILKDYVRKGKALKSASDVDKFLKEMRSYVRRTSGRPKETSNYLSNIQTKMDKITSEPRTCLAN